MPNYSIRTTNSVFVADDDDAIFDRPHDALASGVHSAIQLTGDAIAAGKRCSAVEVCVCGEDGATLLRSVVALSVSPLLIDKSSVVPLFG